MSYQPDEVGMSEFERALLKELKDIREALEAIAENTGYLENLESSSRTGP